MRPCLDPGASGSKRVRWLVALASTGLVVGGCGSRNAVDEERPEADDPFAELEPPDSQLDLEASAVDIVLVIDDSASMTAAQDLLARSVPYWVDRLLVPSCVNGLGNVVGTPVGGACEKGVIDFAPATDVRIAVLSSSLGGLGADSCSPAVADYHPNMERNAAFVTTDENGEPVDTFDDEGFLYWAPGQGGQDDAEALSQGAASLVRGVRTLGCGFEAPLEAVYRFLVDPEPYASIQLEDGIADQVGIDDVVLEQRASFLRDDSLVQIVVISDEDDCSVRADGTSYVALQQTDPSTGAAFTLPRARAVCKTAPDDPCCDSCANEVSPECTPTEEDTACQLGPYTPGEDPLSLRCFAQKRRFGVDFLYPVERYVEALSEATLTGDDGQSFDNPLFVSGRDPRLVRFAAIVGVPWQDVAIEPTDLASGYRSGDAIDYSVVLPNGDQPPRDPLMIPSLQPRSGTHPLIAAPIAPPNSPSPNANPINGHEHAATNYLQYACIFPLPEPEPCVGGNCPCSIITLDPTCQDEDGVYGSERYAAGAAPGRRYLGVVQGLGARAIAASVCATSVIDTAKPGFGYYPAFDAMIRDIKAIYAP